MAEKSNEMLWHQRCGHLGEQNLKSLANNELVKDFNYNASKNIDFCESCIGGKQLLTTVKDTLLTYLRLSTVTFVEKSVSHQYKECILPNIHR